MIADINVCKCVCGKRATATATPPVTVTVVGLVDWELLPTFIARDCTEHNWLIESVSRSLRMYLCVRIISFLQLCIRRC